MLDRARGGEAAGEVAVVRADKSRAFVRLGLSCLAFSLRLDFLSLLCDRNLWSQADLDSLVDFYNPSFLSLDKPSQLDTLSTCSSTGVGARFRMRRRERGRYERPQANILTFEATMKTLGDIFAHKLLDDEENDRMGKVRGRREEWAVEGGSLVEVGVGLRLQVGVLFGWPRERGRGCGRGRVKGLGGDGAWEGGGMFGQRVRVREVMMVMSLSLGDGIDRMIVVKSRGGESEIVRERVTAPTTTPLTSTQFAHTPFAPHQPLPASTPPTTQSSLPQF